MNRTPSRRSLGAGLTLALCALAIPHVSRAQVFGQFTGATTLPVNGRLFGAYLHTSDKVLGATAQLRLSFFPDVDFGFQAGLTRLHLSSGDRSTLRLGTDLKFLIIREGAGNAYSLAAGGALGVENSDAFSEITIAPQAVASRTFALGGTTAITPYLGAQLAVVHSSIDGKSDSILRMPLRLGSELTLGPTARLTAELQLIAGESSTDHYQITAGANFPF